MFYFKNRINIGIESGNQDAESHAGNLLSLMPNKTEMQLIALMDFCTVLLIAEGCMSAVIVSI